MITIADILVVAAVAWFVFRGWQVGLEKASVAALEVLGCFTLAVLLHEALAGLVHAAAGWVLGDSASQAWAVLLAFSLLAWGSFAALRYWLHRDRGDEPETEIDPLSDRLGGAVAGGIGGALFAGGVMVTLSMTPFLAGLKPSGDRMLLDVGKLLLRSGGQFALERHEGRSLPLEGEPPSRMSDRAARLTSEPWFDVDDDGACTPADRYRDVDGSGVFTKDLYFSDVDADGVRRVGLVDKYVAGRWDAALMSDDRPRPDLKKPAVTEPAKRKPEPAKPAKPAKPESPKPAKPEPAKPEPTKPVKPEPGQKEPEDEF